MNSVFIFDVDGTLTPSRQRISLFMAETLKTLSEFDSIFLATGSDYPKTVEQLGEDLLLNHIVYSFNCSGNSVWDKGREIEQKRVAWSNNMITWLADELVASNFKPKTGNHFDYRPGLLNFSILGRNATEEERQLYIEWDEKYNERELLAHNLNRLFSDKYKVCAQVAGKTGIDITRIGQDKSQILEYFADVPVKFFGDDTQPGGNDHTLAQAILKRGFPGDEVYAVSSPKETQIILSAYLESLSLT